MIVSYKCPSCGQKVQEMTTTVVEDMTRLIAETTMIHPPEMDAACRLVMEAIADERKRMLNALMLESQRRFNARSGDKKVQEEKG